MPCRVRRVLSPGVVLTPDSMLIKMGVPAKTARGTVVRVSAVTA